MRIDEMINYGKMLWSFFQILSTRSLRKCMEIYLKNLNMDIGSQTVDNRTPRKSVSSVGVVWVVL